MKKNVIPCGTEPNVLVHFTIEQEKIVSIYLYPHKGLACQIEGEPSKQLEKLIQKWMNDYSQRKRPTVDLPLDWQVLPPYTLVVLKALQNVPLGEVVSYQDLAKKTGNPRGARAVGNACARNPFALVIPCHRVIASNGNLGGFSGGLGIKEALLDYENRG